MDIFYSAYTLTPLKLLNRLSSFNAKDGVYLKTILNGQCGFADYFPHSTLGDRPVGRFLQEFKDQPEEHDKKILYLLEKDVEYQKIKKVEPFVNHQLWTGSEPLEAKVIKYKLMGLNDDLFLEPLKRGLTVRLDGNALFTRSQFMTFFESIPAIYHPQIEYIEDPLHETNWQNLPLATARDFIAANSYDYYIHKPNCEFRHDHPGKTIFSAYMGSDLGTWHTYCELQAEADLSLTHGIVAKGYFREERGLYKGYYSEGVRPDLSVIKNIYQELHLRNWKYLCTI